MSDPTFTTDDLYELVASARNRNPFDGRTREGKAWADGAWAVMEQVYAAEFDRRSGVSGTGDQA